jgi:microcompartment protein CcmK/EutM
MFLAKVVGTVWSTKKTPDLEGVRFLIVHPFDLDKEPTRNIVVVADRLGAGTGEMVMCALTSMTRSRKRCAKRPAGSYRKTADLNHLSNHA